MAALNLYIDCDRQEAVASADDSSIVALPPFVQEDSLTLRVWLLTGKTQFGGYSKIPVSGITLEMAIGTKVGNDADYATQQFTWTASGDLGQPYFEATLPMNTEGIESLLGDQSSASSWFHVRKIDGGTPRTILLKPITVHASVVKDGTLTVPPGATPLSAEAANASYVRVVHTGSFDLMNANGKGIRIYCDEDGAFRSDPITP